MLLATSHAKGKWMRNFRMEVTKSNADGAKDVTWVSEAVQMRKAQATLRAQTLSRQTTIHTCFITAVSKAASAECLNFQDKPKPQNWM